MIPTNRFTGATRSALLAAAVAAFGGVAVAQEAASVHRPMFLPSGDEIILMSNRDDGDWELYRVALDGSHQTRLTEHPGWDGYADVSPDGRRIVFDRNGDDGAGIMIADSDGTHADWLLEKTGDAFQGGARFAPDGDSVVFLSEESGNREIYRLWLADGRRERLTETEQDETDAVFGPDGRRIAYAVWLDEEHSAVEVLDLRSGAVRRLAETAGRAYGIAWMPTGDAVLFNADPDGDQEIYRVDLAGGEPQALTDNAVPDHLAVVSPDGTTVLYTSDEAETEALYAIDLETGAKRRIEPFPTSGSEEPTTALVGVHAITMSTPALIEHAVVLIRGGRIEAIGPAGAIEVPADARVIDGDGAFVLPGLIDAHVHLREINTLRLYLAHGFPTVRDMNGNLSLTRAARDLVEAGEMLGARVVAAGPTMLSGPFSDYPAPQTAAEGRQVAEQIREQGFDLIKVFRVQRDAFTGLIEAAEAAGVPVAGHVPDVRLDDPTSEGGIDFDAVLASRMQSLEHILEVAQAGMGGFEHPERLGEVARRVAASGIAVGTLAAAAVTNNRLKEDREGYLQREATQIERMVGASGLEAVHAVDTDPWEVVPEPLIHRIIREFHEAGVRLIVGTDSHHPVILAGSSGLDELELLVAAGLSPTAALRAATSDAADVLGLSELGRVQAGARADLLLVAVDPTRDIRALRAPIGVMRDGVWLDADGLHLLLEAARLESTW